ncbi:hypothetical protein MELA_00511 [Candidatus Methylomirabilis lanthanidiphila]|uniref:Uncharacterized protein n=1 Tax=Candidatus Methylomirabilis lanthanidiphila TaxID=2211376 RepID=A0A564ZFQ9_9BACT|nr:hypothetical protein [Candidatus Methylomirabilis lanthanidiphila]VUZ84145.1 hypothetical protein MELA_00511 [Candidatus Methylomirabilis lanthanidiphila]
MGQMPPEYLPKELWPQRIYTLPEFTTLPREVEFLDRRLGSRLEREVSVSAGSARVI